MSKKYKVTKRGDGYYSIEQVDAGQSSTTIADSWDEALDVVRQAEKKRSRKGERNGCLSALLGLFRR